MQLSVGWICDQMIGGDVHVYPMVDYMEHVNDASCWCVPQRDEDPYNWVLIHRCMMETPHS